MNSVVLNNDAIAKLKSTQSRAEIRDADGNVVGRFQPAICSDDIDQFECPVSDEEIEHRAATDGGRPLREILQSFKANT